MKSLHETQVKKLEIDKPDFSKKLYNIINQNEIYGSLLEIDERGSLAEITTQKTTYSVKRLGFF